MHDRMSNPVAFLARAIDLTEAEHSQIPQYPSETSASNETVQRRSSSERLHLDLFSNNRNLFAAPRPASMPLLVDDDVEELVKACLDTTGIDRRYSAVILEELRDCTNLTPDQLRQAAHEITTTFGSNSPQYASFTSSVYDSVATRVTSSDERLFDSANHYPNV